ncbi:MAG: hypothetical protein JWN19_1330, partial [Arthrobacter sp.]|nr:hypothetical protein [Arthrobacter sp.]
TVISSVGPERRPQESGSGSCPGRRSRSPGGCNAYAE